MAVRKTPAELATTDTIEREAFRKKYVWICRGLCVAVLVVSIVLWPWMWHKQLQLNSPFVPVVKPVTTPPGPQTTETDSDVRVVSDTFSYYPTNSSVTLYEAFFESSSILLVPYITWSWFSVAVRMHEDDAYDMLLSQLLLNALFYFLWFLMENQEAYKNHWVCAVGFSVHALRMYVYACNAETCDGRPGDSLMLYT
jgi:hypothetical protein